MERHRDDRGDRAYYSRDRPHDDGRHRPLPPRGFRDDDYRGENRPARRPPPRERDGEHDRWHSDVQYESRSEPRAEYYRSERHGDRMDDGQRYNPRPRMNDYDSYRDHPPQPGNEIWAAYPNERHHRGDGSHAAQSRFQEAQKSVSPPTQSAIFLGLPFSCDESMLQQFLESMGCAVDQCTIIRDRGTGQSRRFGFARFVSVEHARAFVEPNFPTVIWKDKSGRGLPDEEGCRVKIDFAQTEKHPQMKPPVGKSNIPYAPQDTANRTASASVKHAAALPPNDGTRDIGPLPNRVLLVRGLDPLTRENEIAAAFDALPGLAADQRARQVMHVRDRSNKCSQGFAFVSYQDAKLAADVLSKIWDPESHSQGWLIRGHMVTVTFAHNESFRPAYAASSWSFKNDEGKELLYWDERAYVSSWQSANIPESLSGDSSESKPLDDTDAFLASFGQPNEPAPTATSPTPATKTHASSIALVASASLPAPAPGEDDQASSRSQMNLPVHQESTEFKSDALPNSSAALTVAEPDASTQEAIAHIAPVSPPREHGHHRPAPSSASSTIRREKEKKGPEIIASKKAAPNIAKWNSKQIELHTKAKPVQVEESLKRKADEEPPVDDNFPHADADKMICLLCQRQFKSLDDLSRHNDLSNLHKTNLQDPEKIQQAVSKKLATASAPKYRDRAAERRQAFNQPDKPVEGARVDKRARKEPATALAPSVVEANKGIKEDNIGHKMLAAAGWKKGESLGNTNGLVDPVAARMYAAGAGLGAGAGATGQAPPYPRDI